MAALESHHWSIHDVAPDTLAPVTALLERLTAAGIDKVALLVIPGRDWLPEHVEQLRRWHARGYELAAHGWSHRAPAKRTWTHRLHAAVLSQDAAEHLSREPEQVLARIERGLAWFAEVELPPPAFYVPPAWAMGRLPPTALAHTSIRIVETLTGLVDVRTGSGRRLPLIGFETPHPGQARWLRLSNQLNLAAARLWRRPVRVAVHPHDARLHLRGELDAWIRRPGRAMSTQALLLPDR